jgi:hypothetical protein
MMALGIKFSFVSVQYNSTYPNFTNFLNNGSSCKEVVEEEVEVKYKFVPVLN